MLLGSICHRIASSTSGGFAGAAPPWPAGGHARPDLPSLAGYVPGVLWEHDPATRRQLRELRAFGLDPARPLAKGEAHHLLDQCLRLAEARPPGPAEAARLEAVRRWHYGFIVRELRAFLARWPGGDPYA